jgi:hypothetical protein
MKRNSVEPRVDGNLEFKLEIVQRWTPLVRLAGLFEEHQKVEDTFVLAKAVMDDSDVQARAGQFEQTTPGTCAKSVDYQALLRSMTFRDIAAVAQRVRAKHNDLFRRMHP